jgi:Fe-S cluster biogenesis protein NfuA
MFIQTEETPNPRTLKFIPGKTVMESGTITFVDVEDAKQSPLAENIFSIKNVEGVFFGSDFITVTKSAKAKWETLKPQILATIMEYFVAGIPLFRSEMHNKIEKIEYDENDPIIKDIITMLETRVRPAVASDGGDILFKNFKDGIVYLELHGSCSGCPSSTATLKNGIESMLKHYIPEVLSVEAVNGTNSLEDL